MAVGVFYYPTLFYPPRGDQLAYLADTAARQDPRDLVFGCYDLTRNRVFVPGDELLFRPLLYAILGVEQAVFGHVFWAWQLCGLLAHMLVVWVLLRFLWRLAGPWLAFAGTWLFSLSWAISDMVTWSHVTSYLVMMAAVVAALEQAYYCLEEGRLAWPRLLKITACFLPACFIHESANVFAVWLMLVLMLAFPRQWRRALVVAVPAVLYAAASVFNFTVINHLSPAQGGHAGISRAAAANFFLVFSWWTYVGMFSHMYHYVFSAIRAVFVQADVFVFKPLVWHDPATLVGLAVPGTWLGLAGLERFRLSRARAFSLVLVAGMLVIFVGLVVLGRQDRAFANIVRINTYYQYIFWVFMLIAGYHVTGLRQWSGFRRALGAALVSACLLSGVWQGWRIFRQASEYSSLMQFRIILTRVLDKLVREEGGAPGFSIYVSPDFPGNYTLLDISVKPGVPPMAFTYVNMLYWPYIQPAEKARFRFLAVDKRTFLFCDKDACGPIEKAIVDILK